MEEVLKERKEKYEKAADYIIDTSKLNVKQVADKAIECLRKDKLKKLKIILNTMNTIGKAFRLTVWGESHGRAIGTVVDGCPAGLRISESDIQKELDRRKPGQSEITTQRKEEDKVEIMSGIFNSFTTGSPISMLIFNEEKDSSGYEAMKDTPRPGHADLTARMKYGGFNDYHGGGMFSGRITACFVMGGSVAKKLLSEFGIKIIAYTKEIADIEAKKIDLNEIESNAVRCPDRSAAEKMIQKITEAKADGDSVGGVVEAIASGIPIGLGEPIFDSVESELSKAFYSIPAVKGVEFGSGFDAARMRGSENNDPFVLKDGKIVTKTNNAGGILGGVSNGMPIVCRVAIKPTPSIAKEQRTIDLKAMKETGIVVEGRHDPCIVPRAVPVVEAIFAIMLSDFGLRTGFIPRVIKS